MKTLVDGKLTSTTQLNNLPLEKDLEAPQTLNIKATCSGDGRYFACVVKKQIFVIDFDTKRHYNFASDTRMTCIEMKQDSTCFAVGDEIGKIHYYYDFLNENGPTTSTRHWHANPVKTLEFTKDGAFLLSGGKEAVVVLWHQATQQNSYISRVGNHIISLSTSYDGSLTAISMADNSIKVIRSQNYEVVQHIKGLLLRSGQTQLTQNRKFNIEKLQILRFY